MSTAPANPRQMPASALAAAIAEAAVAGDQFRMDDLGEEVRYRAAEPTADPLAAGCAATPAGLIAALRARALSDRARWDELAAEHGEAGQDWQEERCYGRVSQCDDLLRYLAEAEAQLVDVAEPAVASTTRSTTAADRELAGRVRAFLGLRAIPEWAPQAASLLQETVVRGLGDTRNARVLLQLHERSGSPSVIPDTPAGRIWLRETAKALQQAARAGDRAAPLLPAEDAAATQRECRWHGPVDDDHYCVRPGESAGEAAARALGEIRDV